MVRKIERARALRRDSTRPEKIFWELIRAHRMDGIKFRRQHPIGPCFADFACISRMLVIEIDGRHHDDQLEADARRTQVLKQLGWRVLRFGASEVIGNPESAWTAIDRKLRSYAAPLSPPLPLAGERRMRGRGYALTSR